jgi:prepilin-type N-terminal cleavage/methylation domain-containing protein
MKMFKKDKKSGFTLMELLVVMTIIAILASAMVMGYGSVTRTAQRQKASEAVSQTAQALSILLNKTGSWPAEIISYHGKDGAGRGMVKDVAKVFAKHNLLGISKDKSGEPIGISRFGVVDPWAEAVLKKEKATQSSRVSSGGTVLDHIIYYAVDEDGDGITVASVSGQTLEIRATAVAWCAGADGKLEAYSRRGHSDDIYSWAKGHVVK